MITHSTSAGVESGRLAGALLSTGAAAWAIGTVVVGEKIQEGIQTLDTVTGMMFVAGVWAFVWRVWTARATGERLGRVVPFGLLVLLPAAFLLNVLSFGYATHDEFPLWLQILDAAWPLSMLGMLALGITIAAAGRVEGPLRWLPLLAGLWFPVTMAAQILGGPTVSTYVSAAWLIGTYGVIGLLMARR